MQQTGGRSGPDVVTALGSAWTTAGLYPDVAHREPFVASVARIAAWRGADLGVRSGGFVVSGEPVAGPDAAGRLANALFLHGTETIGFSESLTSESLARFFRMISLSPEVVADQGGLDRMVDAAGLAGIRLMMRAQLTNLDGPLDGTSSRPSPPDEPEVPFELSFFDRLEVIASQPDADERTAAVMDLVDGFTELDGDTQADLLDRLLGGVRADLRDLFLDQLAPEDLARIVEYLDPTAFRVLGEYVSYIEGPRQGELTEAIGDPASVAKFRARVAESVRDRMEGIRLSRPTSPTTDMDADPDGWFEASVEVMGGLPLVEDRPDRLEKVADAWRTRVSVSLAGEDERQALAWYRSIADLEDPPDEIIEIAPTVPSDDDIRRLVQRRSRGSSAAEEFVDLLLGRDPARVVGPLAAAGEGTDHLTELAAADPDAAIAALEGAESPLPIIVALKAAGYRGADPRVVALLDDPATPGRSEVLVLVGPSLGVDRLGRLLLDDDAAVRRQAAELLRRGRTPAGARMLFDRFEAEDLDDDERGLLAHLLAATPEGAQLLEGVASRASLMLSGTGRKVRSAARAALRASESR